MSNRISAGFFRSTTIANAANSACRGDLGFDNATSSTYQLCGYAVASSARNESVHIRTLTPMRMRELH
jgi:hypothetical protein